MATSSWLSRPIKGFLLDITGVLYESGLNRVIPGSIQAIERLKEAKVPFYFLSNETQRTGQSLAEKLNGLGFSLRAEQIITPGPSVRAYLEANGLRPHLLVHPGVLPDFEGLDTNDPNCVVLGDAAKYFTYENMNTAFQLLMKLEKPLLLTMGMGKFYQEDGELVLDLGAYAKALEYACDIEAMVFGKPSRNHFQAAVNKLGLKPDEVVMIGDDIMGDVQGAQKSGLRGVLVRTGKYRPHMENHPVVKPDAIVDNLLQAVEQVLNQ